MISMSLVESILDVVGRVTRTEIRFVCPQCDKKSALLNLEKKVWHCFLCDSGGSFYPLAQSLGVNLLPEKLEPLKQEIEKASESAIPKDFYLLDNYSLRKRVFHYLEVERGMDVDLIVVNFQLYVDRSQKYLVFPVWENNKIVYWQGRTFYRIKPKTLNPPNSYKEKHVFNLETLKKGESFIINEGIFSTLSVLEAIKSAIYFRGTAGCIFGNMISEWQIRKIIEKEPSKVILMLDPDTWRPISRKDKRNFSERMVSQFREEGYRGLIKVVKLEKGDPNEITHKEIIKHITSL